MVRRRFTNRMPRYSRENSVLIGERITSTGTDGSRLAAFAAFSAASFFHNGDSSRLLNTNSPSTELMIPVKNMQRQPHTSKSSPGKMDDIVRNKIEPSNAPSPAPPPPIKPDP